MNANIVWNFETREIKQGGSNSHALFSMRDCYYLFTLFFKLYFSPFVHCQNNGKNQKASIYLFGAVHSLIKSL